MSISQKNKNKAGFAKIFWAGDAKFEDEISKKYGISIRCIPFNGKVGKCIFTGKIMLMRLSFLGLISSIHAAVWLPPRGEGVPKKQSLRGGCKPTRQSPTQLLQLG